MNNTNIVIVGGGIVGLTTAYQLLNDYSSVNVTLLEKENNIGLHQTTRNSGVIHAGLYYKPNSERAKLCVSGAKELYEFIEKHNIKHERVGKLVVATNENQLNQLNKLYKNSLINGVDGVQLLNNLKDIKELEANINAMAAIYSPNTGIVDYSKVAECVANLIKKNKKGKIITSFCVNKVNYIDNKVEIFAKNNDNNNKIIADYVIVCGGLHADWLAEIFHSSRDPEIIPFRGHYLKLNDEYKHLIKRNIYPVPDPRFPFLGVHLTPTVNGEVLLGPNAIVSFHREGYDSIFSVNSYDIENMLRSKGYRKFFKNNFFYGIKELYKDINHYALVNSVKPMFPWLTSNMVTRAPEHTGIRGIALSKDGKILDDFLYENITNHPVLLVRNAPSPAATACFSIAKRIVNFATKTLFKI